MNFTVIIELDEDGEAYNASVPSLPGCLSWGPTKKKALASIKDAILCYLEVSERRGDPIHPERPGEVELATVRIP